MADDPVKQTSNWLKLTPNLEHFDPFEGLSDGLAEEEEYLHIRYGFRIAGQNILIDKNIICEVIQNIYTYPVPNLPEWVTGMLNLRGNLIPVINLGQLLLGDTAEYTTSKKVLLVIDRGEKSVATYMDELPVALQLEEEVAEKTDVDPAAAELVREFTRVAYKVDDITWHEIDHAALFRKITATFNRDDADSNIAEAN